MQAEKKERHYHTAECWKRYEPCGEHHPHSYSCGGGELNLSCPRYEWDLKMRISGILSRIGDWRPGNDYLRRLEEYAKKLGDEKLLSAVKTLREWR